MSEKIWNNLQLLTFAMTIAGQVIVGSNFLLAETIWLIANVITLARDFAFKRPFADKVKDGGLTALTIGLITAFFFGAFH